MLDNVLHMVTDEQISLASRLKNRKTNLLQLIVQQYPNKKGVVVLFAPTEPDHSVFLQDSSFFYFTNINEPACVLTFGYQHSTTLHMPNFGKIREQWVHIVENINEQTKSLWDLDHIALLGKPISGYSVAPYFPSADYQAVIDFLMGLIAQNQVIFTLYPSDVRAYASVKRVIDRLSLFIPNLMQHVIDVSELVTVLRRKKDLSEIESLYKALEITNEAFQAAEFMIKPGVNEAEVQAAIEYIFTERGARSAYQSIVAAGKNGTILHYHTNQSQLQKNDLILIDAGAMFAHYCADISRTFAVSKQFSRRQKELYDLVRAAQEHVASQASVGMWLNNAQQPEQSLQHIALQFLKDHGGYDQYFPHSIGHFLGLDVHDVGSRSAQLQAGDVITIEPGIYIPDESMGIRIEDNYWIVPEGPAVCLSEGIEK